MDKLVIYDAEYDLPEKLTLDTWGQLMELQNNNPSPQQLVSTALNIPITEINKIPDETLELLIGLVYVLINPEDSTYNKMLSGGELINFKELTLGQFIDLEVYMSQGVGQHIVDICNILYNTKLPNTTTINDVHKAYLAYTNYRTMLLKSYSGLFEIEDELTDEQQEQIQKDNNDTARTWYNIVMLMCAGDILKMNDLVKLGVIECFNWLAWDKDNKKREAEQIKKQMQLTR